MFLEFFLEENGQGRIVYFLGTFYLHIKATTDNLGSAVASVEVLRFILFPKKNHKIFM